MTIGIAEYIVGKFGRHNRAGGNAMGMFERSAEFGDTRRATVSTADAHDGGVPFFFNFRP